MNRAIPESTLLAQHRPKMAVALLLTFASGLVDILGYLGVFHLFTAHITGTSVQLGHNLAYHDWSEVCSAAVIVAAFVLGSILGRAIIEVGSRKRVRKVATITLVIEAILLAGLAIAGAHAEFARSPYAGLAVLAGAMGLQTATLTGIGPLTVHTTFVTGMVNKFAQLVSHIAFRACDTLRGRALKSDELRQWHEDINKSMFLAAIWMIYVGGAAFGTWFFPIAGLRGLYLAVALLMIAIAADQFSPLSIREEKEQSER